MRSTEGKERVRTATVHIGTSGWHYEHWKGPFYPEEMQAGDFLEYYSSMFSTVEINSSFYRLPEIKTLKDWRSTVRKDFVFSIKASRFITHNKKLKDPETTLGNLFERTTVLGGQQGPVLFQLPPGWNVNTTRLEKFLAVLPPGNRYAFEFRNHTWLTEEVYSMLRRTRAALCVYDLDGFLSPGVTTTDFAYIRLHGPDGPYRGEYTDSALKGWVKKFSALAEEVEDIYCYFDNDEAGFAAVNALRLKELAKAAPGLNTP